MDKLLITGANGFIGSFLVEHALDQKYKIIVSARPNSDLSYIKKFPIEFVTLSLDDVEKLKLQLIDIDPQYIIHNAGLTKAKTQESLDYVNVQLTTNLGLAAQSISHLKKFLFVSSLAAFGPADGRLDTIVTHDDVPRPITMYGRSKLKAEQSLKAIQNLPLVIIRPTAVYGPREKDLLTVFKMVNKRIASYVGKGDQKITLIYVKDLVKYMIAVMQHGAQGKAYFASDGNVYSPKILNEAIGRHLQKFVFALSIPKPVLYPLARISEFIGNMRDAVPALNVDKLHEITAQSWVCDSDPLYNDTRILPSYSLDKGIKETIDWYKENGWL